MAKTLLQFHEEAEFLRESSGSTKIEKTLLKALTVLKLFHIPHYVCGGFAVQERGYPRFRGRRHHCSRCGVRHREIITERL
jgi:hypothetical protein